MGPGAGVVILALMAGGALVRLWAARRVRRGDRRAVPLLLLSTLVVALLLVGAAVWFAFRSPVPGALATIGALVIGGAWLRVSLDTARYAGPQRAQADAMDALADRMERAYRSVAAGLLGIGFVILIALVILLLTRGGF